MEVLSPSTIFSVASSFFSVQCFVFDTYINCRKPRIFVLFSAFEPGRAVCAKECLNGGTCVFSGVGTHCVCVEDYYGEQCQFRGKAPKLV